MKSLVKVLMKQVSICGGALLAILILSGVAAYADEAASNGKAADGYIFTLNQKSAESLYNMKEQRTKALEARKAEQEDKACKQAKKAKIDKLQGKTGRTATSWQVLNR
ncbi:MAG: hypothetical protein ACLP2P_10665 [Desulfobaccales bacterium]